jgi:twinkle protein
MSYERLIGGEFKALAKRGITEETCRRFGYRVGEFLGDKNTSISPTTAMPPMTPSSPSTCRFRQRRTSSGSASRKDVQLFGQHLWGKAEDPRRRHRGRDRRHVGVSQQQNNKWPVVSIPSSALRRP